MTDVPGRRWRWAALAGLLILSFLLYHRTLRAPFFFDDYAMVAENPAMQRADHPWSFFRDPGTFAADPVPAWDNYRPLSTWSLAINTALFGMRPFAFRLVTLLLHCLNGLAVFWLARRCLGSDRAAWFVAAVFLIHPVQIESVVWITCRSVVLSGTFFLLALVAYVEEAPAVLGLLLYTAGLFTKEQTLMLPAIQALWMWLFSAKTPAPSARSLAAAVVRQWPFLVIGFSFIGLRTAMLHKISQVSYGGSGSGMILWRQLYCFLKYLKIIVLPSPLSVDYQFPWINHLSGPVAGGAVLLALFFICAWATRRKLPAASFGLFFFLAMLLPVSGLIPLKAPMAERFLYLPLVGIGLAAAAFLGRQRLSVPARWALYIVILMDLSFYAWIRLSEWREPRRLIERSLLASPQSAMLHFGLGLEDAAAGDLAGAEREFETSARIDPSDADSWLNLARLRFKLGRVGEALPFYQRAFAAAPTVRTAYELAVADRLAGHPLEAVNALQIVAQRAPADGPVRRELALAYQAAGQGRKAREVLALSASDAQSRLSQLEALPPPTIEQVLAEAAQLPL